MRKGNLSHTWNSGGSNELVYPLIQFMEIEETSGRAVDLAPLDGCTGALEGAPVGRGGGSFSCVLAQWIVWLSCFPVSVASCWLKYLLCWQVSFW